MSPKFSKSKFHSAKSQNTILITILCSLPQFSYNSAGNFILAADSLITNNKLVIYVGKRRGFPRRLRFLIRELFLHKKIAVKTIAFWAIPILTNCRFGQSEKRNNTISQMRLRSVFKMRTSILKTATTEQMGYGIISFFVYTKSINYYFMSGGGKKERIRKCILFILHIFFPILVQ